MSLEQATWIPVLVMAASRGSARAVKNFTGGLGMDKTSVTLDSVERKNEV
jgi:hypothetical protein